jgi:Flp pilus assembly pilin Flp
VPGKWYSAFSKGPNLIAGTWKRLWQQDDGQDLVEYGLLLFLVALVAVASMKNLASSISAVFKSAATSMTSTS